MYILHKTFFQKQKSPHVSNVYTQNKLVVLAPCSHFCVFFSCMELAASFEILSFCVGFSCTEVADGKHGSCSFLPLCNFFLQSFLCVSFVSFQNGLLVVYCRWKLLVHYFAKNFMIHPWALALLLIGREHPTCRCYLPPTHVYTHTTT
jgi:hypothetical protein